MTQPGADPLVGRTVAHYEIVARLGGGGMGVVYHAIDRKLGRDVALKFLPQQWSHDEGAKQRFLREAQAASATDHPNICTIHDIATADDGQLFIVMARYSGDTLKRRLEAGPLPIDEALDIATQVADGLGRAHAQGVVHRDIKPGNLILTEDGVRIVDFGLATFVDALQLTAEGSTLGTAAYMSPEQVRGEEVDARADVWAVGVVLYQMLVGHPPFRGAYAEAIGYAIRNEPPPALRGERPEIPEDVEQLVFRALHKDPAIRFQSGRELARALRQVRGLTVPMDLRTVPIVAPDRTTASRAPGRRMRRRLVGAAVAAAGLLGIAAGWAFWPQARQPVVIAPVANGLGSSELNDYRLALTQQLILQLDDSRRVRAVPYGSVLQIARRFLAAGVDVSNPDVIHALNRNAGAPIVIVPTVVDENGRLRAKAEIRSAETANTAGADVTTEAVRTALTKETAHQLMASLADAIDARFATPRSRARQWIVGLIRRPEPGARRFATLDAARLFADGTGSYEALEYDRARMAFEQASMLDPQSALAPAWISRVAALMRQDRQSADAAERARKLLSETTPWRERVFVEAIAAEARRDFAASESLHGELVEAFPDEPAWLMELAAFQDRRLRNGDAIDTYHRVLAVVPGLARARVELCRLYNRINDSASARDQGRQALARYRALGDRAGETQALFCLTETVRTGGEQELPQATRYATEALDLVRALDLPYNQARAHNYVALAAEAQGNLDLAIRAWEEAGPAARAVGNLSLASLVLMNLGVTHEAMGHAAPALASLRDSHALYQQLGNEARAAEIQANIGLVLIEYGIDPEEGVRNVRNALGIFAEMKNRNFEVFGAQTMAHFHRYAGRLAEADQEANRALNLARERALDSEIGTSLIGLAQVRFDAGDYEKARDLFAQSLAHGSTRERTHGRLRLAHTLVRLGDLAAAAAELDGAARDVERRRDDGLRPLLHQVKGELSYESRRNDDARREFAASAALWADGFPDEASVESRGYLGLLQSDPTQAQACVEQAQKMRRLSLETRCRIVLARLQLTAGTPRAALATLERVPADTGAQHLGPDLRAQVHYWRAQVSTRLGDSAGAAEAMAAARSAADVVRAAVPQRYQEWFTARLDMQPLFRGEAQPAVTPAGGQVPAAAKSRRP